MPETVDNIELDIENVEFNNAVEFVRHTDKLVYLTGKAGTGKTTFLKYIKDTTNKNTVILAPTGVAAINAGGVTINSFFQIPFGPFVPNDSRLRTNATGTEIRETIYTTFRYSEDKREIIENLELLIIDEISMVRADMLDVIDRILKVFRKKPYLPFGGVQVILIGDTFQLPPIAKTNEWNILSQFYKTPFFFSSKIIEQNTPLYIELKKIYRQNEQEFIDLLNRVRVSKLTPEDFTTLNSKYNPHFSSNGNDYIILATHKDIVNEINLTKLDQLKTKLFTFEATVTGKFPESNKPTDHHLQLKIGSQIMFIKNDTSELNRFINGTIAKIKELKEDEIIVEFDDDTKADLTIEKALWENIQYTYNKENKRVEEEIVGTFEQFPIQLAWAITVHKSQGLTFEKVIADLGRAFAPGQVYVALSRCTSYSGLMLKTQLTSNAIRTDPRVIEFAQNKTPGTLITEQLNTGKADFYYKKARENFGKGKIKPAFDFFKRALKFRNDIDTDIFKKFIEVQGKRFLDFKQKNSSLIEQLGTTNNKISEQDSSIELLLNKISEFKHETEKLKDALHQVEKKLLDEQLHSSRLETKLLSSESHLQKANKESETKKTEIERLKNLKWYHKLIGIK